MGEYLDVKKTFAKVLGIREVNDIDEDVDIEIPVRIRTEIDNNPKILFLNKRLREAYDSMKKMQIVDMQLFSEKRYEVAVKNRWMRIGDEDPILVDTENGVKYSIGMPSLEYILMVCDEICSGKDSSQVLLNMKYAVCLRMYKEKEDIEKAICRAFRFRTICIETLKRKTIESLIGYCNAYEYLYMYKTRRPIMRIINLIDLYERNGGGRARVGSFDEPPRRTVNQETLGYYAMGIDSEDPFTSYISFYHVLEYYFDEAYRKRLVDEMKNRLTNPSFSYKDEDKIYALAKWIGKRMKNDVENGQGNEFDSLKYVLESYVPIDGLLDALDDWNYSLKDYYRNNNVVFTKSKKDLIAWSDREGVYTNLANRIYEIRNALVHSKSGQSDKQYKPQKHREVLLKELPLIQVIAELIIFKDGEAM